MGSLYPTPREIASKAMSLSGQIAAARAYSEGKRDEAMSRLRRPANAPAGTAAEIMEKLTPGKPYTYADVLGLFPPTRRGSAKTALYNLCQVGIVRKSGNERRYTYILVGGAK